MSQTITKSAHITWRGNLKEGKGVISTESGALTEQPYGFNKRFTGEKGTNPEELIAAAHASCFTMALSKILGEAGHTAEQMDTQAKVVLSEKDGDFSISQIHLKIKAQIDQLSKEEFQSFAEQAKEGCPVSKLFNAPISLECSL
ncbi:MAG: peroxiredoxin [Halobacteriovoraceae bacterium]|nr:peroxiredoxin [Halobacteriovoraceae bacterium]|tara:strand:+ start:39409 stop:39840 length:432 start_codon:yes stop_codon:yes gene_type:complete